jgi:hypothetical protein
MAHSVWHGQGWQGWSTYNNGKYLLFLPRGRTAASALTKTGVAQISVPFDGPKHSGPYAVRPNGNVSSGSHPEWAGSHDIRVGGKWYTAADYLNATSATGEQYPRARMVPVAAITVMANFIAKALPHDDAAQNAVAVWNESGGHSKPNAAGNVLKSYCDYIYPINVGPNPDGGLPGQVGNKVLDSAEAIKKFFAFITDPHNWLRLAFFIIGGALVIFSAYKMSGATLPAPVKAAAVVAL